MMRALEIADGGTFGRDDVIDGVTLDLEDRRRRRQTLTGAGGTSFLVDLASVPSLKHGDGFRLEYGGVIEIHAAPEALMEISPSAAADLPRIAWHLGNRHLPVQFVGDAIRLRADHVIEAMLRQLGAEVIHINAPFDPEGGAYGHGHPHNHDE